MAKRHSFLETGKSVLIGVLALSSLYLALRSQLAPELAGGFSISGAVSKFADWFGSGNFLSSTGSRLPNMESPVRIAVYNATGRRGVQYNKAETDKLFEQVSGILGEALDTAREPVQIKESQWQKALGATGCYFDFLGNIPLAALSAWLNGGEGDSVLTASARRILVAKNGDGETLLYYINASNGLFYACQTGEILQGQLDKALSGSLSNGATFAFEQGALYKRVDPYTMMLTTAPSLSQLNASNPVAGEEGLQLLLKTLGFNSHTTSVYPVEGGRVVKEGNDTLRISDSGTVIYDSAAKGNQATFQVAGKGEGPSQAETVEAIQKLAARAAHSLCGEDVGLYLIHVTALEKGVYRIRFGYSVDGAPVLLSNRGYAAEFLVEGTSVQSFTFRLRAYTASGENAALLPERQAVAALDTVKSGGELMIGYVDGGENVLQPGWLAR